MTVGFGELGDRLLSHVRAGTVLSLVPELVEDGVPDESEMRTWGVSHEVDVGLMRAVLRGELISRPDPRGLRLRGARLRDRLDLDGVTAVCALILEDCLLDHGLTADGANLPTLRLVRCQINHDSGPAIGLTGVRVDGPVVLTESVIAADDRAGAVVMVGARVGGEVRCSGARIRNSTGSALAADRAQVEDNFLFEDGFVADGHGERGAVRLTGARIGGRLGCRDAQLRNPCGPALSATDMQTVHGVFLEGRFVAEGEGRGGAVRLVGMHAGGELDCSGATIRNTSGPALVADGVVVLRSVYLNRGLVVDGAGPGGAVRMLSSDLGRLSCAGATLRNHSGPALVADGMRTRGDVILGAAFVAEGAGERGVMRFVRATLVGQLDCRQAAISSRTSDAHRWAIDGLTYSGVPLLADVGNRQRWLEVLRDGTPRYAAQPYQQLAAAFRGEGHDGDVRAILMQQRRDQLDRGVLERRADRWWGRLVGVVLGYGYQPWRALLYLAGVLVISVVLAVTLGAEGAMVQPPEPRPSAAAPGAPPTTPAAADATQPCTVLERVSKGLDLGTPFLPASPSGACELAASPAGTLLTISRWLLQLAAWALAALFVAGFTGVVRKT